MRKLFILSFIVCISCLWACKEAVTDSLNQAKDNGYYDIPFIQETHEAFKIGNNPGDNEVRSIAVDRASNIWIATATGVFEKKSGEREWLPVISGDDRGPAYSVEVNDLGEILLGTWNGLYRYSNSTLVKEDGPQPPVSEICHGVAGDYALGPFGIWRYKESRWEKQEYTIARSVRDALTDSNGDLWVATDAGLFFCRQDSVSLFQDVSELISSNVKAVAFDTEGLLWAGVLGGVSVRDSLDLIRNLTSEDGIPSANVHCIILSPDSVMWVGTDVGIVRYAADGSHSIRFSRRWLTDNSVNDIAFDAEGNAWIATADGVSEIKRHAITLREKEQNYYGQLMRKHMREPWTCGVLRLESPGDTSTWRHSDDDNDGEYTGGYLAMESFRYAATGDPDALMKARKAFSYLKFLQEVTGTDGFFARSVVPADWTNMNDPNRKYNTRELAEELVKDPRYKPVEQRWRKSKDGRWLWKGDTSSDEMDGHMMSYFFYYELAAGEEDKILVRNHVRKIIDCLIKTGYNLVDIDGTHTHWGVWSPEKLNHDPDWASEKALNSFELLAYLKLAAHITGDEKYEKEYVKLIEQEGYLDNASQLNSKNPAWQIYFDRTMEGYLFPILLKYEENPEYRRSYEIIAEEWIENQEAGENLINNFTYAFATGERVNLNQSIDFLKDAPLDLVDWTIDHTLREDVHIVRKPILEEIQVEELPAASERATVRWDRNPWAAREGNPAQVREPVFWLWPYWMARYLDLIHDTVSAHKNAGGLVKIGMCSDAHLPTMHDAESRISAFIDTMNIRKPDFIIELGDFAEAPDSVYYKIWNSFRGQKYHVIGNHEMDGGHSLEEALRSRNMKSSYYSFETNGFHFIVLDGNDRKAESVKGYKQFIGEKQVSWFKDDLRSAMLPVVIFSHQGLLNQKGAEEAYGVENAGQIRDIIEDHNVKNPSGKVIACFNGHTHWDYAENVNNVWYITINSMSYNWLGEAYQEIRYSEDVDKTFKWIKYTAPFRDPLYTIVEISKDGFIKIEGRQTEWVGSTPFALGYPERMKEFIRPAITERTLRF